MSARDNSRWPDGTVKSLNNAFTRREPSGFATPQELGKVKAKMGGQKSRMQRNADREVPQHPVIDGLSERARRELTAAPASLPLAKPEDALRRQRMRKAAL